MRSQDTFYIRWRGRIEGPFDKRELLRRMAVEELGSYDEISQDKKNWCFLKDFAPVAEENSATSSLPSNAGNKTKLNSAGSRETITPARSTLPAVVQIRPSPIMQTPPETKEMPARTNTKRLVWAVMVDWAVVATLSTLLTSLVVTLSPMVPSDFGITQYGVLGLAMVYVIWTYWALQQSSTKQATLGQYWFGLQLRQMDASRVSYGLASRRILFAIFFFATGIGLVYWLGNGRKNAAYNQIFKTCVVSVSI